MADWWQSLRQPLSLLAVSGAIEGLPRGEVLQLANRAAQSVDLNVKARCAIELAMQTHSAEETTLHAANLGEDADTIAAIGSAIAGAIDPGTVNAEWWTIVARINGSEIVDLAEALLELRR